MPKEFRLPDLGEGIHEGEVIEVLVSVGDRVEDGQTIMIVETDKASSEVPSPVTGTVKDILVKVGETVKVGDVMMTFYEEGEEREPEGKAPPGKEEEKKPTPAEREEETSRRMERAEETARETTGREAEARREEPEAEKPSAPSEAGGPVPAAPSTRRLARELGVDLREVKPSGPGGRVTSEDVYAFAEARKRKKAVPGKPAPPRKEEVEPAEEAAAPSFEFDKLGPVERIPLRSVRKATAKHMALAWQQVPHVSHQDVADVTELEAFRQKHKDEVKERGGALSLTVFAMKAAVAALKAFPRVNASIDLESGEIILKRYYHIGVAVDSDRGLIVPVIRDVDRKSITELSVELKDIVTRTREGRINQEELSGGTFTITNVGILGGTGFAPIVNFPQAAILGMAKARLQPVVRRDIANYKIVPRLLLPLIIGFDHRIIDGADAARFMNVIIETLENPEKMLMVV